jgi:FkbM family methyltransferase
MKIFVERKLKQIKRKFRFIKLKLEGNEHKKWFGSEYGGFFVCEEILKNREQVIVYSCGVGKDISFDVEMMKKYKQSKIFAFDPTPISMKWIENQQLPDNFFFFPIGISDKNGIEKMYFPKNFGVSYGVFSWDIKNKDEIMVEMHTIERIAEERGHKFIDILKMDIEGSEFVVLNSLDFEKIQFGQILVEFHERFLENGDKVLKKTIAVLEANGYECFAVSDDFEYSFINKRFKTTDK